MSVVLDFLFPSKCVVCSTWPQLICNDCIPSADVSQIQVGQLAIWRSGELEPRLGPIIRAFKDRKLIQLAPVLAQLLDASASRLATKAGLIVIPPTSRANYRSRGFHPMRQILASSRALGKTRILDVQLVRQTAEQRNLERDRRFENLSGSYLLPSGSGRVLLLDDVVTTGATMTELYRCTRAAGYEVVGCCAIAASSVDSVLPIAEKGVVW